MKRPTDTLKDLFRRNRRTSSASDLQAQMQPLPALVLHAETIAASLQAGLHGRRRSGSGEDFWQFRPYRAGEPATSIDWRQSARSPIEDLLWVRERERENAQTLMVWCDPSASMNWRSSNALPTKAERAQVCALALAAAALRGGERAGLLTGIDAGRAFAGRQTTTRLAEGLLHPRTDEPEFPNCDLAPSKSDLVIVSDFLWEEDRFEALLRSCTRRAVHMHLLCILDPAERAFQHEGRVRFEGLEGGVLTLPATESLGADYDRAMQAHLASLRQAASSIHAACVTHDTSQNPLPALLALHGTLGGGQ